VNERVVTTD